MWRRGFVAACIAAAAVSQANEQSIGDAQAAVVDLPADAAPRSAPSDKVATDRAPRPDTGGKAVIRCAVTARGTLDRCTVLSQDPPDGEFGEMALRMSKEMRVKGAAAGGTMTIPITFKPDGRKR